MALNYQINRYNGMLYANIPNDQILGPNQPTQNPVPLNLIGRNRISYGKAQNENFLWLTENFAGDKAPSGSVPGQLWYNYSTDTGQLLVALKDSARQPDQDDPSTELDWASIPMISNFNTVPDASTSLMGRMVLTNNADSLRVLMRNKEWREIQTARPKNKEFETLLDILYDTGKTYISYTATNSTKNVSIFNSGSAGKSDASGYMSFADGDGVLRYGSNYFYDMKIMARQVSEVASTVIPSPAIYKTWIVKGSFYINNEGTIVPGVTKVQELPDPRKIANLTSLVDVIDQSTGSENWGIQVLINGVDPNISVPTGTTVQDYTQYVTSAVNSSKHLGFRIQGNVDNLGSGQTVLLQYSAQMRIIGIPPV